MSHQSQGSQDDPYSPENLWSEFKDSVFPMLSWQDPCVETTEIITAAFGDNANVEIRCRHPFVEVEFDHYPTENLLQYLTQFSDPSMVILHVYGPYAYDVRAYDDGELEPQRVILCFNTSNLLQHQ